MQSNHDFSSVSISYKHQAKINRLLNHTSHTFTLSLDLTKSNDLFQLYIKALKENTSVHILKVKDFFMKPSFIDDLSEKLNKNNLTNLILTDISVLMAKEIIVCLINS